ncbi:MAG: PCMD domain-containing protein [Muribaculum sp.]|nr:PCMD domain-containing protein [Muribaculaceae bacterium]MCM1081330.1 PCMD domain-containing protein [Muribaculum sp.]
MKKLAIFAILTLSVSTSVCAQKIEPINFGNFETWVTRNINESRALGGNKKVLYEIGPETVIDGNKAYIPLGGSPWATSNVYARVVGISKGSNAVFPDNNPEGGRCCKLTTMIEECTVLGLVDLEVLVSGSIYLGWNKEPISSTSNPYGKMEMGIPFTKRPKTLRFDYRLLVPKDAKRIHASGRDKKELDGQDHAEVYILLQRRWEDEKGNLYAKRVGTGRERYSSTTNGWVKNHDIPVIYGDATTNPNYKSFMQLIPNSRPYYARNSKGKLVPVKEVGWDSPDATPTHMLVMASSGCGTAYEGTPGMTFWVDNFALTY